MVFKLQRRFTRRQIGLALALAAVVALTTIANQVIFNGASAQPDSDGAEVRVAARAVDDGRVEVAVQQLIEGSWGELRKPTARYVPADAERGAWLTSSNVTLAGTTTAAAMPEADDPLFCIVSHGGPDDFFWRVVKGFSKQAAIDAGLNVRYRGSLDGAEQAAHIAQCSADGAAVIASTLADPDAVRDALLAAKAAGARIVTFNSGAEHAEAAGSELHIALDDAAAGRLVAEVFNEKGISGSVACLVHETNNVGLTTRCTALAAAYDGGDVVTMMLPEGADQATVQEMIVERLRDAEQAPLAALVALNSNTIAAALNAILATTDESQTPVQLGAIGASIAGSRIPVEQSNKIMSFIVFPASEVQGYLITAAMQMAYNHPMPAEFFESPTILSVAPRITELTRLRANPAVVAQAVRGITEIIALGQLYDSE